MNKLSLVGQLYLFSIENLSGPRLSVEEACERLSWSRETLFDTMRGLEKWCFSRNVITPAVIINYHGHTEPVSTDYHYRVILSRRSYRIPLRISHMIPTRPKKDKDNRNVFEFRAIKDSVFSGSIKLAIRNLDDNDLAMARHHYAALLEVVG